MPATRYIFSPQNLTSVYTSPSGMVDLRTGLQQGAGGLCVGAYTDLTEAEAQLYSTSLHEGRYRFVQIDSGATAANVKQGTIGLMSTLAKGVNVVTSYDKGLAAGIRPVVFLAALTAAQIAAGAYVWVQESGIATVLGNTSITKAGPAAGDIVNSVTGGLVDDPTSQNYVATTLGVALATPAVSTLFTVFLELPMVQG